jgi:hypothetical protein
MKTLFAHRAGANHLALLVAGAFFMEFLDGSIVATALPRMAACAALCQRALTSPHTRHRERSVAIHRRRRAGSLPWHGRPGEPDPIDFHTALITISMLMFATVIDPARLPTNIGAIVASHTK